MSDRNRNFQRFLSALGRDFRRKLLSAPFVLELIGVLVVGAYTFQACKANKLTRQIITLSQAAILDFRCGVRWERNGIDAEFLDVGKVAAFDVAGTVTFLRENIANSKVLQETTIQIRRAQLSVGTSALRFIPVDVPLNPDPQMNMPLFQHEFWKLNVSATYNDGFGNYRPYETCLVMFVEKPLNSTGWNVEWRLCEDWPDLRKDIETRQKYK